jgi:hypothetical protein
VYRGGLPASINPANTAVTLGGRRWTMVVWPLPADPAARRQVLAHELWHRIQDSLGLPMNNPSNGHLDREPGRIWLRLEARALIAALEATGPERVEALVDALSFRAARTRGDSLAERAETSLERNEGLAEYTGVALSGRSPGEARAAAAKALGAMERSETVSRSFAYATGPAYGLLLDDLRPGWRLELRSGAGIARLAGRAVGLRLRSEAESPAREVLYLGAAIRDEEAARSARRAARHRDLVALLVTGPGLRVPLIKAEFGFDPGRVETLDSLGSAYGALRLSDEWGVLDASAGSGLIGADYRSARVAVGPGFDPRRPAGPGWRLDLRAGWTVVPDSGRGTWRLERRR